MAQAGPVTEFSTSSRYCCWALLYTMSDKAWRFPASPGRGPKSARTFMGTPVTYIQKSYKGCPEGQHGGVTLWP
jgi:hypothetical protein